MQPVSFSDAVERGEVTEAQALALFDSLEPVETDFMLGAWTGAGFPTNHPLDGALEAYHWYGKRFENNEEVHPLLFLSRSGRKKSLNPAWMRPALFLVGRMTIPKSAFLGRLFQACLWLLSTRRARARLRVTRFRGKDSATMIYDDLPVNDVFGRIDENTVLGVMDQKGVRQPFFFVLKRERENH